MGRTLFFSILTGGQEKILAGSRWEAATEACNLKASVKLFLYLWEHVSTSSWESLVKMMYFHARQIFIFHFLLICPEVSHQCICPAHFSYTAFWRSLQNSKKQCYLKFSLFAKTFLQNLIFIYQKVYFLLSRTIFKVSKLFPNVIFVNKFEKWIFYTPSAFLQN